MELQTPQEPNQIRALEIYLETATFDNGYKPSSLEKIANLIKSENLEASSSSIGRWKKLFSFEKHLDLKMQTEYLAKNGDDVKNKAISTATQETVDRFKTNGNLIDDLYIVASCFVDKVKEDIGNNNYIRDDIKLAKDLLILTTGREDKMLDRLANTPTETVSSDDILKQIAEIEVDIEDADIVEIEE